MKDNYKVDLTAGDNSAESVQKTINYLILWGGIIVSLILGIIVGKISGYEYSEFRIGPFIGTWIAGSFISIIIWSFSMILINISINLRSVKHLLAQQAEDEKQVPSPLKTQNQKPSHTVDKEVANNNDSINENDLAPKNSKVDKVQESVSEDYDYHGFKVGDEIRKKGSNQSTMVRKLANGLLYCRMNMLEELQEYNPSEVELVE